MSKLNKFLFIVLIFLFVLKFPDGIDAAISGCNAVFDTQVIGAGRDGEIFVNVTNNDIINQIKWVKISRPSDNYSIIGASSEWSQVVSLSNVIFNGSGTIDPGIQSYFLVQFTTAFVNDSAKNWLVEAADNTEGSNTITCSGSTSTQIELPPGPSFSSISVSILSNTSALVNWGTDRDASSIVEYGLTDSYGVTTRSQDFTSIHSVLLAGLTSGTTYHYRIKSVDRQNLESVSGDDTFITSGVAGLSPTGSLESTITQITPSVTPTTTSSTTTTTVVITPTPTPDTSAPVLILQPISAKPYQNSPEIKGTAVDNKAVSLIEYNIDSDRVWQTISRISVGASVQFAFTPTLTAGKHILKVRAKDAAGNISQIQTMTLLVDNIGPEVKLVTSLDQPFIVSPDITITVSDENGIGDAFVSLDGGNNWQMGEKISTKSATMTDVVFQMPPMDDGNYELKFKVLDVVGNVTQTPGNKLVIDRLPPIIGSPLMSVGPLLLDLKENHTYRILAGLKTKVTFSVIGGPTDVVGQIEVGITNEVVSQVKFLKIPGRNLWEAELIFPNPGIYRLNVHATDGANNNTERDMGNFSVTLGGKVTDGKINVADAKVTVYAYNQSLNRFLPWDALMYGFDNPGITSGNGTYQVILPGGKYFLKAEKSGYLAVQTDIFSLNENTPVLLNLPLIKQKYIKIGSFRIAIPDWSIHPVPVILTDMKSKSLLIKKTGFAVPETNLTDGTMMFNSLGMRGKPTLITFLNTWQPNTVSQLNILEDLAQKHQDVNFLVIVPHESQSYVNLFKKRGGFILPLIADPDGKLDPVFNFGSNPAFYFADNNAVIKGMSGNFLSETKLTEFMDNVMMK